jgi:hypothetical protein
MRFFAVVVWSLLGAIDTAAQTAASPGLTSYPGYEPGTVRCALTAEEWGYGLHGTCVRENDRDPSAIGSRTDRTRFWPAENVAVFVGAGPKSAPPWRGHFVHPTYSQSFEIVQQRIATGQVRLLLRTVGNGWVVVQDWRETEGGSAALVFRLNYAPATADDIAILTSAFNRLRSLKVWDRQDDRDCANDTPGSTSLFCLLSATVESRMGRYHHSQPALEVVRSVINERWPERLKGHGLMDFNNHPATTMEDLRTVLESALARARVEATSER